MKKEALTVIVAVALALIFLVGGCAQQGDSQIKEMDKRIREAVAKIQEQPETEPQLEKGKEATQKEVVSEVPSNLRMGNLCSSLSECFVFCKNNVGRCTDFCVKNPSHDYCKPLPPAKNRQWVPDSVTQPLPEGASKVRLILPALLNAIPLTQIGAYGAHRWGHSEGLDHEWIPVKQGVIMTSWADGYVVWARPAPGDASYDLGLMNVVIYYGDGLWGEHMGLDRNKVLVKEGQRVKAGDPIGYGPPLDYNSSYQFGEFNLADQHRRDGVGYWYKFVKGATLVSPFDYLREDVKQQLVEKWQKEIIDAYLLKGDDVGIVPTPWEPYLTNPILFHQEHKGTLTGEWFLRSKLWAFDDVPDILIFLTNSTQYYNKQKVSGVDDDREKDITKSILSGDWDADYQNNRLIITTHDATYFGIFELDESAPQAKLKIEYQTGTYPTGFSELAAVYTERERISKGEETHYWKYPEDDPRNW